MAAAPLEGAPPQDFLAGGLYASAPSVVGAAADAGERADAILGDPMDEISQLKKVIGTMVELERRGFDFREALDSGRSKLRLLWTQHVLHGGCT